MMQGDSYKEKIELVKEDGTVISPNDVLDVEIAFGSLIKTHTSGAVTYADGKWLFPLTQEETFAMLPSVVNVQARIMWPSGDVEGVDLGRYKIGESNSKAVLG